MYLELREKNHMNILEAMEFLGRNKRIRRYGDMTYLVSNIAPSDFIVLCDLGGMELTEWVPTLEDLLAEDWEAVD